jgi:hypothetical protein
MNFGLDTQDKRYLDIVLEPIRVCTRYKPRFGQGKRGKGLTLEQFQKLYQADPFYNWFGLDNPMMYTAHKAAGGMTSVYRQIGSGCEKLFRTILCDSLRLTHNDVTWSYKTQLPTARSVPFTWTAGCLWKEFLTTTESRFFIRGCRRPQRRSVLIPKYPMH